MCGIMILNIIAAFVNIYMYYAVFSTVHVKRGEVFYGQAKRRKNTHIYCY